MIRFNAALSDETNLLAVYVSANRRHVQGWHLSQTRSRYMIFSHLSHEEVEEMVVALLQHTRQTNGQPQFDSVGRFPSFFRGNKNCVISFRYLGTFPSILHVILNLTQVFFVTLVWYFELNVGVIFFQKCFTHTWLLNNKTFCPHLLYSQMMCGALWTALLHAEVSSL